MSSLPCPTCGGALPETLYRRTITCPYCSASHPNAGCLRAGDEVLVRHELRRVVRCEGPDAITVENVSGTLRLDDVIPVVRVPDTVESGTAVYRQDGRGWNYTYTSSRASDGVVKVKHSDKAFQDSFFDQTAPLEDLRLDARPPELGGRQAKRTPVGAFLAQIRDSPSTLFELGVKAFIAVVFVIVAVSVVRAFVF